MKKNYAINALENQKRKIIEGMEPQVWIDTTSELLKKLFPLSGESKAKHISDIYFYPLYERNPHLIEQQKQKGRTKAENYIQEYINEINTTGLENGHEENKILQLLKNVYFWIVLSTFISGAFLLGNHFGISKFDNEKTNIYEAKVQLEKELDEAKKIIREQEVTIEILKEKNVE